MMEKKKYFTPELETVEFYAKTALLQFSEGEGGGSGTGEGEGNPEEGL